MHVFSCVCMGKITMTHKEWTEVLRYLKRALPRKLYPSYSWQYPIFLEDIERKEAHAPENWRNIRVTATELLVKHFKVARYKRENYFIEII